MKRIDIDLYPIASGSKRCFSYWVDESMGPIPNIKELTMSALEGYIAQFDEECCDEGQSPMDSSLAGPHIFNLWEELQGDQNQILLLGKTDDGDVTSYKVASRTNRSPKAEILFIKN